MYFNLPPGWREIKINDLVKDKRTGVNIKPSQFSREPNIYKVVHKGDIKPEGKIDLDDRDSRFIQEAVFKSSEKSVVDRTFLVVTLRDLIPTAPSLGLISKLENGEGLLAQGTYGFRVDTEQVYPPYLIHLSNSYEFRKTMKRLCVGSTQVHLRSTEFFDLDIPIPSIDVQIKISNILESWNSAIKLKKEQIKLKRLKLQKLSTDLFSPSSKEKSSDGAVSLDEAGVKVVDGDRGKNYPKTADFFNEGHCLFLSAKNVTKDGFRFNEKQFINKEKDELLRKGKLDRGDIVLTTRGTVGNIAYFDKSVPYDHLRINSGMVILRNENDNIDNDFLYQALKSPVIDRQISKVVFGSAQPQLTVKIIKNLAIHFPDIDVQKKISNALKSMQQEIRLIENSIASLALQKSGLMQKLLKGDITA